MFMKVVFFMAILGSIIIIIIGFAFLLNVKEKFKENKKIDAILLIVFSTLFFTAGIFGVYSTTVDYFTNDEKEDIVYIGKVRVNDNGDDYIQKLDTDKGEFTYNSDVKIEVAEHYYINYNKDTREIIYIELAKDHDAGRDNIDY